MPIPTGYEHITECFCLFVLISQLESGEGENVQKSKDIHKPAQT